MEFMNEFEETQAQEIERLTSLNQHLQNENEVLRDSFNQRTAEIKEIAEKVAKIKSGTLVPAEVDTVFQAYVEGLYPDWQESSTFDLEDLRLAFHNGFRLAVNIE
jgi:regulator of replication initiation timing